MDPANDIDQSAAGPELDPEVAAGTWVVIPVYNEESVIAGVVAEVQRTFPNVVAVDDGSSDGPGTKSAAPRDTPCGIS